MTLQAHMAYALADTSGLSKRPRMPTTGALLKALRIRAELTNDAVALELGIALSTYSSYESRKRGGKLLPVWLVKGLQGMLVGRGNPPITREELIELAGADAVSDEEEVILRHLRRLSPARRKAYLELIAEEGK